MKIRGFPVITGPFIDGFRGGEFGVCDTLMRCCGGMLACEDELEGRRLFADMSCMGFSFDDG